ncbi:MAG: ferredoxin--NADP reductase [Ignavibacteria bacterium]
MGEKIIALKRKEIIGGRNLVMYFERNDYEFLPGQYARITLLEPIYNDEEGNSRLFSIASSPTKDYLMFTTRAVPSAFNRNIQELPIGTSASISEPAGNTVLHNDPAIPAVFLIGGIGITPVRCMIEYIVDTGLPYQAYLFYSNPDAESMAFLDEFEKWAELCKNFKLYPTIDDISNKNWKYSFGYINKEIIIKNVPNVQEPIYYIVGPLAMVDAMEQILFEMNVKSEQIKLERF